MSKKLRILFIDLGTGIKSLADYQNRAQGGRVTSLRKLPDVLSQSGHSVFVVADIEQTETTECGTVWLPAGSRPPERLDVLVSNRAAYDGWLKIPARRRVLWTHDLPHPQLVEDPRILPAYALTVFMSDYAEWVWRLHFPGIGKSMTIPNGVDDIFTPRVKNPEYVIYISNPNRGLHRLGSIAETVNAKLGRKLLWRAYSNHRVLHPAEGGEPASDGSDDNFGSAAQMLALANQGVEVLDPIPQEDLAEQLGAASLCVLPTGYPEICSNAILQCLASGVPIITGPYGSAPEWVHSGWNGHITQSRLHDYYVYLVELARFTYRTISDPQAHARLVCNAAKTSGLHSWEEIGAKWSKALCRLF